MKNNNFLKKTVLCFALGGALFSASAAKAQMQQYYIGTSQRSELGISVKHLSDGSSIIAGYDYDLIPNSNDVNNSHMLLMRVKNGTILWQQTWGTIANDLIEVMIITSNGDIVVVGTVGRTNIYTNNTAAIFRFDALGNLLYQNYVRSSDPNDIGGEIFYGVCELPNGILVAVGGYDQRPDFGDGLISTFKSTLLQIHSERFKADSTQFSSDGFSGICNNPQVANSVYMWLSIPKHYSGV